MYIKSEKFVGTRNSSCISALFGGLFGERQGCCANGYAIKAIYLVKIVQLYKPIIRVTPDNCTIF